MSLVEIHSDFSHFLAENVSSCMNKFYTPLIQERFHYDAKLSADEENWPFQSRITLRSH